VLADVDVLGVEGGLLRADGRDVAVARLGGVGRVPVVAVGLRLLLGRRALLGAFTLALGGLRAFATLASFLDLAATFGLRLLRGRLRGRRLGPVHHHLE